MLRGEVGSMSSVSMSSVGSYVLSINERAGGEEIDVKTASARVLKLLGSQPVTSYGALLSATGFSESLLREALNRLRRDELVTGTDDRLALTGLGYKAHLIVAT
jgi:hypothetical protein